MKKILFLYLYFLNLQIYTSDDELSAQELVAYDELDSYRTSPTEIINTDAHIDNLLADTTQTFSYKSFRFYNVYELWPEYRNTIDTIKLFDINTDPIITKNFQEFLVDHFTELIENDAFFDFNNKDKTRYFLKTAYAILSDEKQQWIDIAINSANKSWDPEKFIQLLNKRQKKCLQKLHDPRTQELLHKQLTHEEQLYLNNLLLLVPPKKS